MGPVEKVNPSLGIVLSFVNENLLLSLAVRERARKTYPRELPDR
jgi:hypothetical protein